MAKAMKKLKREAVAAKAPKKDPYALDDAIVSKKRKDVDTGAGSNQNWLKLSELMGDKKSKKVRIRILPRKGKGKFWKEVGYHYDLLDPESGNKVSRPCPRIISGRECPICDALEQCRKSGQEEGVAIWKQYRCRPKTTVQCVVNGGFDEPYLLGFTDNQFRDILDMIQDPDLGNMAHPIKGYDVVLNLKKVVGKKYVDLASITEGPASKVPADALEAMEDLDNLLTCDISSSELSKYIYADVKEFLNLSEDDDDGSLLDDDDDEDYYVDEDNIPFESTRQEGGDKLPSCYGAWEAQLACSRCAVEQECLGYTNQRLRDGKSKLRMPWKSPVIRKSADGQQCRKRKVPSAIEVDIQEMLDGL